MVISVQPNVLDRLSTPEVTCKSLQGQQALSLPRGEQDGAKEAVWGEERLGERVQVQEAGWRGKYRIRVRAWEAGRGGTGR